MTETDKIEIGNLLATMKEMDAYAKETDGLYFDKRIAVFAKEARDDYVSNKKEIIKILSGNLALFLGDLTNFPITTSGSSIDGYEAERGNPFTLKIGQGLWITARLTDFFATNNDGYRIYFNIRKMEINNIRFRTSDTDDKRYSICSDHNLVDGKGNFNDASLSLKRDATGWNYILHCANRTRSMNQILVSNFKKLMGEKIEDFRKKANANEKMRETLKNADTTYMKVDL